MSNRIIDADTTRRPDGSYVRSAAMDAPEMDTPEGQRATERLRQFAGDRPLSDEVSGRQGRFGRDIGTQFLETEQGRVNLDFFALDQGLAQYKRYNGQGHYDPRLDRAYQQYFDDRLPYRFGDVPEPLEEEERLRLQELDDKLARQMEIVSKTGEGREELHNLAGQFYKDEELVARFRAEQYDKHRAANKENMSTAEYALRRIMKNPENYKVYAASTEQGTGSTNSWRRSPAYSGWDKLYANIDQFHVFANVTRALERQAYKEWSGDDSDIHPDELTLGLPERLHSRIHNYAQEYGNAAAVMFRDALREDVDRREVIESAGFWEALGWGALAVLTDPVTWVSGGAIAGTGRAAGGLVRAGAARMTPHTGAVMTATRVGTPAHSTARNIASWAALGAADTAVVASAQFLGDTQYTPEEYMTEILAGAVLSPVLGLGVQAGVGRYAKIKANRAEVIKALEAGKQEVANAGGRASSVLEQGGTRAEAKRAMWSGEKVNYQEHAVISVLNEHEAQRVSGPRGTTEEPQMVQETPVQQPRRVASIDSIDTLNREAFTLIGNTLKANEQKGTQREKLLNTMFGAYKRAYETADNVQRQELISAVDELGATVARTLVKNPYKNAKELDSAISEALNVGRHKVSTPVVQMLDDATEQLGRQDVVPESLQNEITSLEQQLASTSAIPPGRNPLRRATEARLVAKREEANQLQEQFEKRVDERLNKPIQKYVELLESQPRADGMPEAAPMSSAEFTLRYGHVMTGEDARLLEALDNTQMNEYHSTTGSADEILQKLILANEALEKTSLQETRELMERLNGLVHQRMLDHTRPLVHPGTKFPGRVRSTGAGVDKAKVKDDAQAALNLSDEQVGRIEGIKSVANDEFRQIRKEIDKLGLDRAAKKEALEEARKKWIADLDAKLAERGLPTWTKYNNAVKSAYREAPKRRTVPKQVREEISAAPLVRIERSRRDTAQRGVFEDPFESIDADFARRAESGTDRTRVGGIEDTTVESRIGLAREGEAISPQELDEIVRMEMEDPDIAAELTRILVPVRLPNERVMQDTLGGTNRELTGEALQKAYTEHVVRERRKDELRVHGVSALYDETPVETVRIMEQVAETDWIDMSDQILPWSISEIVSMGEGKLGLAVDQIKRVNQKLSQGTPNTSREVISDSMYTQMVRVRQRLANPEVRKKYGAWLQKFGDVEQANILLRTIAEERAARAKRILKKAEEHKQSKVLAAGDDISEGLHLKKRKAALEAELRLAEERNETIEDVLRLASVPDDIIAILGPDVLNAAAKTRKLRQFIDDRRSSLDSRRGRDLAWGLSGGNTRLANTQAVERLNVEIEEIAKLRNLQAHVDKSQKAVVSVRQALDDVKSKLDSIEDMLGMDVERAQRLYEVHEADSVLTTNQRETGGRTTQEPLEDLEIRVKEEPTRIEEGRPNNVSEEQTRDLGGAFIDARLQKIKEAEQEYINSGEDALYQKLIRAQSIKEGIHKVLNWWSRDLASRFFESNSSTMRYVGAMIPELGQGWGGDVQRRYSAAIRKEKKLTEKLSSIVPTFNDLMNTYGIEKGVNWGTRVYAAEVDSSRSLLRREFDRDIMLLQNSRRLGNDDPPGTSPAVKKAVDELDAYMKKNHEDQVKAGLPGFRSDRRVKFYQPHIWTRPRMERAIEKYGRTAVERMLRNALTSGAKLNKLTPREVESHVTSMLDSVLDSRYDPVGGYHPLDTGADVRSFSRTDLDLSVTEGELSVLDLLDSDVMNVTQRYTNRMTGYVAMSEATGGVLQSRLDVDLFREAIRETGSARDVQYFDDLMDMMLGRPTRGGIPPELKSMMQLATITKLGGLGTAQLTESGQVVTRSLMHLYSDPVVFKRIVETAGEKVDDIGLMKEIQSISHVTDDHTKLMSFSNHLNPDFVDDMVGWRQASAHIVDTMTGGSLKNVGNRALLHASGYNAAFNMQNRVAQASFIYDLSKHFTSGTGKTSVRRLADLGLTDTSGKHAGLERMFREVVEYDADGILVKLNVDKWDEEVLEHLSYGMHRELAQSVQRTMIGEKAPYMNNVIMRAILQFREFPMVAQNKQLGRALKLADTEAVMNTLLNTITAGLVRGAKISMLTASGAYLYDRDWDAPTIDRLGMPRYISQLGMWGDFVDLSATAFDMWSRHDEINKSAIADGARTVAREVPVLSLASDYYKVYAAEEAHDKVTALQSITMLGNTALAVAITEIIQANLGED